MQWYSNFAGTIRKRTFRERYVNEPTAVQDTCQDTCQGISTRSQKRKREEDERIKNPPVQRVEADFGHTVFPNEIWDKVFLLLSKQDLRSLSLTSKNLRFLANRLLWANPLFKPIKNGIKGEDFETLLHLPIRKLRTRDLYFKRKNDAAWFVEMLENMPLLTDLEVCSGRWAANDITIDVLRTIAPFVTKMTLDCVRPTFKCTRSEFVEELADIDFPKLKSVILPSMILSRCHYWNRCQKEECPQRISRYKLKDLQSINHLPITELSLSCLQPKIEVDEWGKCILGGPLRFPQIPYLLQMKSLRVLNVSSYNLRSSNTFTPADITCLKELQSRNGVTFIRRSSKKRST